jgi:hypothetical protein
MPERSTFAPHRLQDEKFKHALNSAFNQPKQHNQPRKHITDTSACFEEVGGSRCMYKSGQGVFIAIPTGTDRNDIDTRTLVKHHPSSEFIGPPTRASVQRRALHRIRDPSVTLKRRERGCVLPPACRSPLRWKRLHKASLKVHVR